MSVERGAYWSAIFVASVGCLTLGWAARDVWGDRDYNAKVTIAHEDGIDGLDDSDLIEAMPPNLDPEKLMHGRLAYIVGREDLTLRYAAMESEQNQPINKTDEYELGKKLPSEDDIHDWIKDVPAIADTLKEIVSDGKVLRLEYELLRREYDAAVWRRSIDKANAERLVEAEADHGIPGGAVNVYTTGHQRIDSWIGQPGWKAIQPKWEQFTQGYGNHLTVAEYLELQYDFAQENAKALAAEAEAKETASK